MVSWEVAGDNRRACVSGGLTGPRSSGLLEAKKGLFGSTSCLHLRRSTGWAQQLKPLVIAPFRSPLIERATFRYPAPQAIGISSRSAPTSVTPRDCSHASISAWVKPLGFLAAEQPAGAVDGRIERGLGLRTVDAFDHHRIVAYRAAYKAALARERGRRALADHPGIAAVVPLAPGVIVMVVHHVGDGGAEGS